MSVELHDFPVRSSTILTASYVAGTIVFNTVDLGNLYNQLVVYVNFTLGNLTSGQVKIEWSPDGVTYYQETYSTLSATSSLATSTEVVSEHSYANSGKYIISTPIKTRYVRISAKGTGADATNSLMDITASTGVV